MGRFLIQCSAVPRDHDPHDRTSGRCAEGADEEEDDGEKGEGHGFEEDKEKRKRSGRRGSERAADLEILRIMSPARPQIRKIWWLRTS